jgi:uncharacterized protein YndB with AHSA1/START domain
VTGRRCWFNQVAFLSRWTMDPEVRDFLCDMYGPDGLPFDTRYGNGDPIDEDVVRRINDVYEANTSPVVLAAGDVVLVDNIRTAHGREPYEGDRQVVVAMIDPVRVDELEGPTRAGSRTAQAPARAPSRRAPTAAINTKEVSAVTDRASTIVPVTVQAQRALDHQASEVLAAYGDVDRRVRWQADPEEIFVLESHDFRVGGIDHFVYRSRHYPNLVGTVRYERIEDHCLVYTRRLADADDRTVTISVVSWRLRPCSNGTEVIIAEHTTSLAGSIPIQGNEYRLKTMLDRLGFHLSTSC